VNKNPKGLTLQEDVEFEHISLLILKFTEEKLSNSVLSEGSEIDLLMEALFLAVSKISSDPRFKHIDLEKLVSNNINLYCEKFNINVYASDYKEPLNLPADHH